MHDRTTPPPNALDTTWGVFDAGDVGDEPPDPVADLPWRAVEEASGEGLAEREARARIRAQLLGGVHEPLRVGRFRLTRKLGQGGMGTVHAAYDDQLQREVAIKLLHPDVCGDEEAQHRLVREAQAQARLSHPNLVPVFEVGRFEGQIFLAMELVEGMPMPLWLEHAPRSPREILAHWLEVARALVVVHAEGLVHRDVKPGNVLVGKDGRARLVDFGLVRGQGDMSERSRPGSSDDGLPEESVLQQVVTQSMARVGTPAYMAPEVWAGRPAGPLADQYSLCVSIYESLVGQRPFARLPRPGDPGPARATLSRSLHRVLARGLAPEPTARFRDMRALVAALEPIVEGRGRRRLAAGAGLVTALVAGGVAVQAMEQPPADRGAVLDPCAEVDDDLAGVWDDAQRAALHRGLLASGSPHAAELSTWVRHGVDELAEQWLATRRDTCEARVVDRVLSEAAHASAMACLDGRRDELDAIVETATTLAAERLPHATAALAAIDAPAECLRRARLATTVEPPADDQRAAVESLRATLHRIRMAAILDGAQAQREPARRVHDEALALGYEPLRAEASLVLGQVLLSAEDPGARGWLEDAANLGERVGDLATRESALQGLASLAFDVEHASEELRRALARDRAALARLGDPPQRRASALELEALLAAATGDFATAEAQLREVIALRTALGEAHVPARIATWHHLGSLLAGRGRTEEAEEAFATADALASDAGLPTALLGQGSLLRGRGALLRGIAATSAGRFDEAGRWLDQAATETTLAYGSDGVPMSHVRMAQADLAMRQGRTEDALEHARAADAGVRRWLGEDSVLRVDALSAMGTVAFHEGRVDEAVAAFDRALRLAEASEPPASLELAIHRSNLGEALVLAGDDAGARPRLEAALRSMETLLPADDPLLSYPSHGLAELAWRAGELDDAARHGERALRIRELHRDDPPELARTRWLCARIEAARGDAARARVLAQAARDGFASLGPAFAEQVRETDAWLRAQP